MSPSIPLGCTSYFSNAYEWFASKRDLQLPGEGYYVAMDGLGYRSKAGAEQ
jgi:hypothetical protein